MSRIDEITDQIVAIVSTDPLQTAIVLATFVTTIIIAMTLRTHNTQAMIKNFEVIMNYIGNDVSRDCRARIHNNKDKIDSLFSNYDSVRFLTLPNYDIKFVLKELEMQRFEKNNELRLWLEVVRHVSAMYDRVGTLLINDRKLKKKFIRHHGHAIVGIWSITHCLITEHFLGSDEFKKLAIECERKFNRSGHDKRILKTKTNSM